MFDRCSILLGLFICLLEKATNGPIFLRLAVNKAAFSQIFTMTFADSLVIGGGPAGILTIASCLEYFPSDHRILWVDPAFKCGYLSMLDNVPRYRFPISCP